MKYEVFKQKVYDNLIRYKNEVLNIKGEGISAYGNPHDCLFPKPYCDNKLPAMLYEDIKKTVEDIQGSEFAYKPHRAALLKALSPL